jgi:hypothetical protein
VKHARGLGLDAVTVEEFFSRGYPHESFDAVLLAHVLEHLDAVAGQELVTTYLPFLRPGGTLMLICPQERGFASDETHVRWATGEDLEAMCRQLGLLPERHKSFPLPRAAGRAFIYNEFSVRATKP